MRPFLLLILLGLTINSNAQFQDSQLFKHAVGVDIAKTIKLYLADGFNSPELFYRHYLTRYWMVQESVGFNQYKSRDFQTNKIDIMGVYNRLGIHYITYQNFSYSNFKRMDRKEMGSIGLNFLLGYAHHQGIIHYNGALLTPYSETVNQKIILGGIELEWSPILLRVKHFQLNLNFKFGQVFTSKNIKNTSYFTPITGTSLHNGGSAYGSFLGLNTFYRFNVKKTAQPK